jgi:hypothetical protein
VLHDAPVAEALDLDLTHRVRAESVDAQMGGDEVALGDQVQRLEAQRGRLTAQLGDDRLQPFRTGRRVGVERAVGDVVGRDERLERVEVAAERLTATRNRRTARSTARSSLIWPRRCASSSSAARSRSCPPRWRRFPDRAIGCPAVRDLSPSRLHVAWAEHTRSRAAAAFVRAACEVGGR